MSLPGKTIGVAPGAPFTFADLVTYAEGAIVSRTLAKNDHASATLFAFESGQGLSEHTSPFDAYVHLLEGELRLTVGGKEANPAPGQTVLMPARVPHALHASARVKFLLLMLRPGEG